MTDTPLVLVGGDAPVAVVTLNEPESRNPLSPELVRELTVVLKDVAKDDRINAVVVTGAGKGFSAGADLRRMRSATPLEDRAEYGEILELNLLLWNYPKPTIAAVHGFAMGAGANLMSWCDLSIAESDAKLGYPEVKVGVPSATVVPTLLRTVGRRRMFELVFTGETITPERAEQIGLINRVVEPGQALSAALALASTIAGHNPTAVQMTKQIAHAATDMAFPHTLEYAKEMRVISRLRKDFDVEIRQGGSSAGREVTP